MRAMLVITWALFSRAFAADADLVQGPNVQVGDCWSYRGHNIENRGPIREYEECITFIDRSKEVILAVAKVKEDGREIETSYSTEWSAYTTVDQQTLTPLQKVRVFPLRVGHTYSVDVEFRRALLGPNAGKVSWTFTVVGWEDVTVPAGRFRAMKLHGVGTVHRYDAINTFSVESASWYVPEVNRSVKNWFKNPSEQRGTELTGYKPNK